MHKPKLGHLFLALFVSVGLSPAYAVSLGAITVLSQAGQPFSAEIEIMPADEQELATLSATIASPEMFAEQGVAFSPVLSSMHVEIAKRESGKSVLILGSVDAIRDTALDVLIKVDSAQSTIIKKYSVPIEPAPDADAEAVVDLPGLQDELPYHEMSPEEFAADRQGIESAEEEKVKANDTALIATSPEEDATAAVQNVQVAHEATTPGQEPAQAHISGEEPKVALSSPAVADYTVESGDTLRNIAVQRGVDGASLEQMMTGLLRANPHAFVKGNINRLKTGEILHTPSAEEIKAINQVEAEHEVRVHAKNWNAYRNKLANKVAKSAPLKSEETASQTVSGKIDSVKDQAAPAGARDVVKLSNADSSNKADKGSQTNSELQEELIAREKALQESNARILLLEKQLKDARKLIELRKPEAVGTEKPSALPAAAKPIPQSEAGLSTLLEQLQKYPSWAPAGAVIAVVLAVLALLARRNRKARNLESATAEASPEPVTIQADRPVAAEMAPDVADVTEAELSSALGIVEDSIVADTAVEADAKAESDVLSETMAAFTAPQEVAEPPVPEVLTVDDIVALTPEPEGVKEAPPGVEEPLLPEDLPKDAASLAAMFGAASTSPSQTQVNENDAAMEAPVSQDADAFAMDDVFSDQAALAELVAATPATAAPADEVAAAMADEAATDMMAMEQGVQAEDPFDMDDVFSGAVQEETVQPATESVADTDPFAMDDVFTSETALADVVAEAPLTPAEPEDAMAAAMVDEAATDMMAMAAGETEAEDQFALDDVFGDAAAMAETVAKPKEDSTVLLDTPEAKPAPDAKSDDHTAALSAAFDEAATADLADLDFGFDIDLGDTVPTTKTPAKVAEKVPALDFSNINLNVGGNTAATTAESASAEPPEVDTKLDLVTAYIDMSDNDGARELLQEVLKEGGPNQVARAQKMLDSLG